MIAISGGPRDGRQNWSATALKRGATKALAKPFERQVLLAAVADVVPSGRRTGIQIFWHAAVHFVLLGFKV